MWKLYAMEIKYPTGMESADDLIVDEIRRQRSVGLNAYYEDPSFPATDASLFKDVTVLPDYAKVEPRKSHGTLPWLYPHQIHPSPKLFVGGSTASDVVQGQLGDCWLLGAMAAVANHPGKLLDRLFVTTEEDFVECGVMTVQLYKDGEWHAIVVDTRIPWGVPGSPTYDCALYARCADRQEQWVAVLEKAFAKLHGSYQSLNGGSVTEALVDMTGGVGEKVVLTEPGVKEMIADGRLWSKIKKHLGKDSLIGCSMSVRDGGFEQDAGSGILVNHAYSVLYCKEVGRGLKFLKIRNPWGHGEWHGDWSDGWSGWGEHPDVEAALADDPQCAFRRGDDGVFWMVWEDFVRHFNKIYICRVFSEEFIQHAIKGVWSGVSAAGPHKVMADIEEEKVDKSSRHIIARDGDAFWFNNPQFRVSSAKDAKCLISLMQADRKIAGSDSNVPIRFTVTAVKRSHKGRLWIEDPSEIVADSAQATFSQRFPQREVTHGNIAIDPRMAYIVVPYTQQPRIENSFVLRVFSEADLTVATVPDPYSLQVRGVWSEDSAGGGFKVDGRDNPTWCLNPQYCLTANTAGEPQVVVKVVLQRTDRNVARDDKTDGSKNRVGIVVTRAPPPPSNPRLIKAAAKRKTNALGEPLPVKESTLKRPTAGAGAGSGDSSTVDERPPPQRRLEVKADEFCQTSEFCDATVATTLLRLPGDWLAAGLLIHPCLKLPGREGEFTLSVYCDTEVQLQALTQSTYKTVAGTWVKDKSAHGCHLHSDWKRNPAFVINAPVGGLEPVRISLSRPEEVWKSTCKADSVGCMIGFYVVTCDRDREAKFNDGRGGMIGETAFVPMHQVAETFEIPFDTLNGSKSVLVIPATFEPEKEGPFHLSVSMDCEFELLPAS